MTECGSSYLKIAKKKEKPHPKDRQLGIKRIKNNVINIKWVRMFLFSLKVIICL
jgi:hypothetical protein